MSGQNHRIHRPGQRDAASPLGARVVALLIRMLGATWRIEEEGSNPLADHAGGPPPAALAAFYHCDILLATYHFRDRGFGVSVSRSRDGDRITALLARLGYTWPSRGSSSRGGAASLVGLAHLLRRGTTVSIVTDGPRGPACVAKPGVVGLARATGVPITPVRFEAHPAYRFGSWDRTILAWPFARVRVRFGAPIAVGADERDEAAVCRELEARMRL